MNYSVNNLTTVADCNVLLSLAVKEKADLNYKKLSDERLTTRFADTSIGLNADLQGVIAELAATETVISILPAGATKAEAINKRTRLEYKKFLLETRIASYGTVALLEKEMDLARFLMEITEVDAFIQSIEIRKAELAA